MFRSIRRERRLGAALHEGHGDRGRRAAATRPRCRAADRDRRRTRLPAAPTHRSGEKRPRAAASAHRSRAIPRTCRPGPRSTRRAPASAAPRSARSSMTLRTRNDGAGFTRSCRPCAINRTCARAHANASRVAPLCGERVAIAPLVCRRVERRTDEHLRRACAFAAAELRHLEVGFAVDVAKDFRHLVRRDLDEVGQQRREIVVGLAMNPIEKALVASSRLAKRSRRCARARIRRVRQEPTAPCARGARRRCRHRQDRAGSAAPGGRACAALRRRCRCRRSRAARSRCDNRIRECAGRPRCSRAAPRCPGSP